MSNVLSTDTKLISENCQCKSSMTQIIPFQIHMQGTVNQLTFCQSEISFNWKKCNFLALYITSMHHIIAKRPNPLDEVRIHSSKFNKI